MSPTTHNTQVQVIQMILKAKYMQYIPEMLCTQYKKSSDTLIEAIKSLLQSEEEHENKEDFYFPDDAHIEFATPSMETIAYLTVLQEDGTPMMLTNDSPYSAFFLEYLEHFSGAYIESPFTVESPSFVLAPDSFYSNNNIYNIPPGAYVSIHSAVVLQYITPEEGQESVNIYVDVLSPLDIPHVLPVHYRNIVSRKWITSVLDTSYPLHELKKEEVCLWDEVRDEEVWVRDSDTQVYIHEGNALLDIHTWREENGR